ncbi:hypothetical protein HPC49_31300 [Pyxidicoccus fallax]|uniref:Uncharacterized protein n=1 Tax=Pyxidicoccus fallax TaxID=394095 RepID=A0A848LHM6_9BACT|nr:hypothetical protein [Pyxidicoccus fallax]NMO16891.1 hypothetical protein [Pyxidicoccus fallax]NPC82697.1 hypothetical protein [Pyxidicoccus fallax]
MPRKNKEGAPMNEEGKMTEEARKAIYGKSEIESEKGATDEERNVTYSGPSQTGHRDSGPKQGS